MRLTSFVVSRSSASSPLRLALPIAGIGLGIAIAVAIHVLDHNTVDSERRRARRGGADLEVASIEPESDPAEARAAIAGVDGVAAVASILAMPVRVREPVTAEGIEWATLYGVEPESP